MRKQILSSIHLPKIARWEKISSKIFPILLYLEFSRFGIYFLSRYLLERFRYDPQVGGLVRELGAHQNNLERLKDSCLNYISIILLTECSYALYTKISIKTGILDPHNIPPVQLGSQSHSPFTK